ncbi:adenylate/guanylate cyclase domain-containing protein [Sorangium sp. So ce1128]
MAKDRWNTFQEAVAEVYAPGEGGHSIALLKSLEVLGPKHCPAPHWDPHRAYQVALVNNVPVIRKLVDREWVAAEVEPPQSPQEFVGVKKELNMEPKPRTATILFMDVSGWSKLNAYKIHQYVTVAMPKLAGQLKGHDFLNTWGDAIVATFNNAVDAAKSALNIRDFFIKADEHEGVPEHLKCRIALHQGDLLLCHNAFIDREDIFGEAVHKAARLEPITAPGHIFCTKSVADSLNGMQGLAPKAWPLGTRKLAKDYGEIEVFVVTWSKEPDPTPGLQGSAGGPSETSASSASSKVSSNSTEPELSDNDARALISGWLNALPSERNGKVIRFVDADREIGLPPGTSKRLMHEVRNQYWTVESSDAVFTIRTVRSAIPAPKSRYGTSGRGGF